jgi:hypothetical protein
MREPVALKGASLTWCTPGWCSIIDSRSPGFDFFRLSFESLRDAVVNAGPLSREDAGAAAARFAQDSRVQTAHDGRNRPPLNGFAPVERQLPGRRC